jgi:hypothetical protein
MKKFCITGQWRNKLFLIVISGFSLEKATMNAPRVCKLRKNCLTGIDQCAMMLSKKYSINIGAFMTVNCGMKGKVYSSALRIFTAHI